MADNTNVTSPYPYLRKVSSLPAVTTASNINLADTIILVQTGTTKRASINTLIDRIIDQIGPLDAYELAKLHHKIEDTVTIEEWLDSLRGGGLSQDELKVVVGNYKIVKGIMGVDVNNKPKFYIDAESSDANGNEFGIYQDKDTGKCYTKQPKTGAMLEWDGMLDVFTFINDIIGNEENTPTYRSNIYKDTTIDDPYCITELGNTNNHIYVTRTPKLGELIRLTYIDDPYGQMVYYNGVTFVKYTGIIDYIQVVANNLFSSVASVNIPSGVTLATSIENDNITDITAATFDGSGDPVITINSLNGGVISGQVSEAALATKIKTPVKVKLTGAVTKTISNVDMSKDISIDIDSVNAQYITGNLNSDITVDHLSTKRNIGIASGITNDTKTSVIAAKFDGSEPVNIIINSINGSLIDGAVENANSALTANTAGSATNADYATSADSAGTANQLANSHNITIKSAKSNDNSLTSVTAASFNGSDDATIKINSINANLLKGELPSEVGVNASSITGTLSNNVTVNSTNITGELPENVAASKVKIENKPNAAMYLVGTESGSDATTGKLSRSIKTNDGSDPTICAYIDSDGTVVINKSKTTHTLNNSTSSDGFYMRNIGFGTSDSPPPGFQSQNGDIWFYCGTQ